MGLTPKIAFFLSFLCIFCIGGFFSSAVFAQKPDTIKVSLKPKPKVVSRVPSIKGTVQTYKPGNISFNGSNPAVSSSNTSKSIS